jgi:hypothetical protein
MKVWTPPTMRGIMKKVETQPTLGRGRNVISRAGHRECLCLCLCALPRAPMSQSNSSWHKRVPFYVFALCTFTTCPHVPIQLLLVQESSILCFCALYFSCTRSGIPGSLFSKEREEARRTLRTVHIPAAEQTRGHSGQLTIEIPPRLCHVKRC